MCIYSLSSCIQENPRTISEYKQWFNEKNGFIKQREINKLNFLVQYRPTELQFINELDDNFNYTSKEIERIKKPYGKGICFLMEIGQDNLNYSEEKSSPIYIYSQPEYYRVINSSINKGLKLVIEKDTITPSLFHYEREYELTNRMRFLFTFPMVYKNTEKATLIYNDEIFGVGRLKFSFYIKNLKIPKLPLNIVNHEPN